jgi:hypothetical protein
VITSSLLLLAFGAVAGLAAPLRLASTTFDPGLTFPEIPPDLRAEPPAPGEVAAFIVQVGGPVTAEARRTVEDAGEILGYLPDNAFLLRSTSAKIAAAADAPKVVWTGLWHPAFRISPQIGRTERIDPARRGDSVRTLLVWAAGDALATRADLESAGATVLESFPRRVGHRFVVAVEDERIPDLARLPSVLFLEERPDFRVWNDRTTWVAQENVSGQFPLWDHGLHGEDQIITVMDSGLDYNSCWFRDPGKTPGPTHRKVVDYALFGGQAYDGCGTGHGTHVCGTLAGNQTYVNPGQTAANGLAYEAKLTLQDVGNDDFFSCLLGLVSVPNDLTNAFQASYDLGARVHSNSWGSTSNSYNGFCVDIDDFMWDHPDFLVVFAAGNSGSGSGTVGSPGTAKNCVTVGATRQAPNQESIAWYSSRGPAHDSRYKPTLTLPGGDESLYITSADNHTGNPPSNTCSAQGSPFMGTSMATPAVSASAAIIRQYFLEGYYPAGSTGLPGALPVDAFTPSAALVKAMLTNSAADMGGSDVPNHNEGWGRVLLEDVLHFQGDAREIRVEENAVGLSTGQSDEFNYEVETGEPIEITLVWTDYPATSGAGIALVNDLDLVVTGPSGTYRGNVFSGGQSTTGGTADRRNVEEVVRIASPSAGSWTAGVQAHNVPQGPQPYALVSTGAFAGWPPTDPTAIGEGAATVNSRALSLRVTPNPTRDGATVSLTFPGAGRRDVLVEIFDVRGARVAVPHRGALNAGKTTLSWDGNDPEGRAVPPGLYFVRALIGTETITRKLTVVR